MSDDAWPSPWWWQQLVATSVAGMSSKEKTGGRPGRTATVDVAARGLVLVSDGNAKVFQGQPVTFQRGTGDRGRTN